MILNPKQLQKIKDAALADYPNEMCGVCTVNDFVHLKNVSDSPEKSFKIAPAEYVIYVNNVTAIVHSHTRPVNKSDIFDLRTPSMADIDGQIKTGLPWVIVGCEGYEVSDPLIFPRTPSADLIGRPFIWYINDCYTLVMDYYKFNMGVDLPGHDINFDWGIEHRRLNNIFENYIESYGFSEVVIDDIKNGDVILLDNIGVKNHIGVYHDGDIIHQLGISTKEHMTNYYTRINKVLRYVG